MSTNTPRNRDPRLSLSGTGRNMPRATDTRTGSATLVAGTERCECCGATGTPLQTERRSRLGLPPVVKEGGERRSIMVRSNSVEVDEMRSPQRSGDGKASKPEQQLSFFSTMWPILPHLSPELRKSFTEFAEQCESCGMPINEALEKHRDALLRPSLPTVKEDEKSAPTPTARGLKQTQEIAGKPAKTELPQMNHTPGRGEQPKKKNDPYLSLFTEIWPIIPNLTQKPGPGGGTPNGAKGKCDECGAAGVPLVTERRPASRANSLRSNEVEDDQVRRPQTSGEGEARKSQQLSFFSVLWPILPHLSPELQRSFTEFAEQCETCGTPIEALETYRGSLFRPDEEKGKFGAAANTPTAGDLRRKVEPARQPAKTDEDTRVGSLSSKHLISGSQKSSSKIPQRRSLVLPSLPTVEEGENFDTAVSTPRMGDTEREVELDRRPEKTDDGDLKIGLQYKSPLPEATSRPVGPRGDSPLAAMMAEIEKEMDQTFKYIDETVRNKDAIVIPKTDSEIPNMNNMKEGDLAALIKSLEKEKNDREERVRDLTDKEEHLRECLRSAVDWAKALDTKEKVRA